MNEALPTGLDSPDILERQQVLSDAALAEFDAEVKKRAAERPVPSIPPQPQESRTDYQHMNNGTM